MRVAARYPPPWARYVRLLPLLHVPPSGSPQRQSCRRRPRMNIPKYLLGLSGVAVALSLGACEKPYHEPAERYVLVGANINLPYWQEAQAGLIDIAKTIGVKVAMVGPSTLAPD